MQNLIDSRVMVIGDIMLDEYWEGETHRISPEAPVPVVHIVKEFHKAGGAANVALNIASLGGQVRLLGVTGQDEAALKLKNILTAQNVFSDFYVTNTPTIRKLRLLSQNQQLIRADFENSLWQLNLTQLFNLYERHLEEVNLVILSDYGKGTLKDSKKLIEMARAQGKMVLVDPKNPDFSLYEHASIITPNLREFELAVGAWTTELEMAEKAVDLIKRYHFDALLVTRGPQGMTLFQKDAEPIHSPAHAREVYDVTGAGDTVIAVLGMALSAGHDLETSVNLANTAAGVVVGKIGTATVSSAELQQAIHENSGLKGGIFDVRSLKQFVLDAKHKGETVVMTNGCFDILHAGHIDYLTRAKKLGNRLIVAVNDDESVRRLKGPTRPLNTLQDRMKLLSALEAVDWVVPFSEDTPVNIISEILPDILVKGADYQIHEIAGSDVVLKNNGRVETITLTPERSTSSLIEKIKQR